MKRFLRIMAIAGVAVILTAVVVLIPKLRNMESEYATARAIGDLKEYLQTHDGRWPESPGDLGGRYPVDGSVQVDYSMTSARLIESPSLLREAVRPRSGRFQTFPHFERMIGDLHAVLKETNPVEAGPSGSGELSR